jgi:hypothetical protein
MMKSNISPQFGKGMNPRLSTWKPLRADGESASADFHVLRKEFIPPYGERKQPHA